METFTTTRNGTLGPAAEKLRAAAFSSPDPSSLRDVHTHVVGLKNRFCQADINKNMLTWRFPIERIKALVYLSGSGLDDEKNAFAKYTNRLISLIDALPAHGKYHILGFDWHYLKGGERHEGKSTFYTSNECIEYLWKKRPDLFVPVISVHPYRKDAVARLDYWAGKGVRYIKWLPSAQGIDPSDPDNDNYYRTMIRNNMVLLSHVGEEKAVEAEQDQELANPLCFRRPLDMGLKIIMAHAGSLGKNRDVDKGANAGLVDNFDLFIRLFGEKRYRDNLFGEISGMTLHNRLQAGDGEDPPLVKLMRRDGLRRQLATRFVNGSDYPLIAINIVIRTGTLVKLGLITAEEKSALNEIYRRNPLEFDYVLKRTLKLPGTRTRLPPTTFALPPALEAPYPQRVVERLDDPAARASWNETRCRPGT